MDTTFSPTHNEYNSQYYPVGTQKIGLKGTCSPFGPNFCSNLTCSSNKQTYPSGSPTYLSGNPT